LNIKNAILDVMKEIKEKKWKVELCPETMGKINIFGSVSEILKLVEETGCSFCIDFAHLWARNQGKISYEEICKDFQKSEKWHCHFSGIVFGDKGEKHHKPTPSEEITKLLKALPKDKDITIINEAPEPVKDAAKMVEILKKI
jgi:endonuclease IV